MKKILALVLALVMTMSLVTISSGAAYSDADSVQYTDAVTTLSALGVLGGYADGSIRPQADVSRGAAAKMVAMVATGSNTTTLSYYAGTSAFADVPASHTFADAVAYCVGKGIVDGYGDGTYGVGDNVKGWAVAKMVLVAMGYDAEAYGLTGAGAALRTIELATDLKLFAGMKSDFSATAAASREECAQIVYNALNKACVEPTMNTSTGVVTYSKSTTECLLDNYVAFAIGDPVLATLTASYAKVITANDATLVNSVYTTDGTDLYNVATGLDLIGHKVLLIPTSTTKSVDKVTTEQYYDVYGIADLTTAVVEIDAYFAANATNFKAAFGYDSVTCSPLKFDAYTSGASDTVNCSSSAVTAGTYVMVDNTVISWLKPASYSVGYVSQYAAGNTVTNGKVEVKNGSTEIIDDTDEGVLHTKKGDYYANEVTLYDGIAVGDVVIVEKTGEMNTITKAATAVGKVSKVDTASTAKSIVVDGKSYGVATLATSGNLGSLVLSSLSSSLIGTDVTLYLDNAGKVVAIGAYDSSADAGLVYVVAKYYVDGGYDAYGKALPAKYFAQVVDMDGKEVAYQITAATYNLLLVPSAAGGTLTTDVGFKKVAISYNDTLKADVATFNTSFGTANVGTGSSEIKTTNATIAANNYFASGVKFLFVSGKLDTLKVTVKDGVQAVNGPSYAYYANMADASNYNVQYVVVNNAYTAAATVSSDVLYLASVADATASEGFTNAAGQADTAWYRTAYLNGAPVTIKMENAALGSSCNTVGFYTYTTDEDGFYTLTALSSTTTYGEATSGGVEVTNLFNDMITAGALNNAKVTSDTKIVDLYAEANYVDPITSAAGLLKGDYTTGAKIHALYTVDANGVQTVSAIYVLAQPTGTP